MSNPFFLPGTALQGHIGESINVCKGSRQSWLQHSSPPLHSTLPHRTFATAELNKIYLGSQSKQVFLTCRLAVSRAQRNDADVDMKQLVEQITIDLLLVHNLPEWPAALPMLLRLVNALLSKAGMYSPDSAVRLVSIDLLGLIAAQLCYEACVAGAEAEAVADVIKEHGERPLFRVQLNESA